jgi:NAD(P)-dependent dehydrogenase (short-subunit alcohol dehydrogenase family)
MRIKDVIKRSLKYILQGVPVNNVKTDLYQVSYGNLLEGKKIIITGGSRGLGYSIAKKCISEGATVLISGRDMKTLNDAVESLGPKCKPLQFDVGNAVKADVFITKAAEILGGGKIDCLVNNAGISLHENNYSEVTIDGWDLQMNTNLKGAYFLTKAFVKYLESFHEISGNILMISSERGLYCDDVPYGLSKASLNSMTRGLSRRLISNNIRVNAIAPGVTATDMTGYSTDNNLYCESSCGKRVFLPEEIAEVAVFLLSDVSKCISGEVIACDQGNYLRSDW